MSKRMSRKNVLSKKQRKAMKEIAKEVVDEEVEDKAFVYTTENNQLNHNVPVYSYKFLTDIQQGYNTGDSSTGGTGLKTVRIGDEIQLKNINIRFWLSNKLDRPNVIYKAALYWYPIGIQPSNALIFKTQSNKLLDRYDRDNIKVIDTFIVKSTNNYAVDANNHEHSYLATLNKSYKNKKIKYDKNGTQPKGWDIGLSIVCYDAFGTLQTDNIASFAFQSLITFQDA
jgi:hypothetical protein